MVPSLLRVPGHRVGCQLKRKRGAEAEGPSEGGLSHSRILRLSRNQRPLDLRLSRQKYQCYCKLCLKRKLVKDIKGDVSKGRTILSKSSCQTGGENVVMAKFCSYFRAHLRCTFQTTDVATQCFTIATNLRDVSVVLQVCSLGVI